MISGVFSAAQDMTIPLMLPRLPLLSDHTYLRKSTVKMPERLLPSCIAGGQKKGNQPADPPLITPCSLIKKKHRVKTCLSKLSVLSGTIPDPDIHSSFLLSFRTLLRGNAGVGSKKSVTLLRHVNIHRKEPFSEHFNMFLIQNLFVSPYL